MTARRSLQDRYALLRVKRLSLIQAMERAKEARDHDQITPIAADLKNVETEIQQVLHQL